jgi:transcriptional regulator with XRE-family HTH domain
MNILEIKKGQNQMSEELTARDFKVFLVELKRRRKNLKFTQSEIAAKMGVSYQSLNRWENTGFRTATVHHLLKYVEVLESRCLEVPPLRQY